ncbi:GntP family permease [Mycoplasma sp. P36-A1]|uniref:GntP family permease n=1 Tax=Mycoplasma sp. P36-A1 TaxID=3252900 RepID=UPI003C2C8B96
MDILGVVIIVLSLLSLMYFAYKGMSVIMIAPVLAMITAFIATGTNPLYSLTEDFMPSLVSFVKSYFPLFLVGSIFGKIMGNSGAAKVVAMSLTKYIDDKKAILIVVLATAILTYGGVSLFVVVFAVYPIAVELFRKADIPKRLIAPTIALGGFTFTMTALPGTPQSINAIPTKYLGTTIYAAPILGIIAALVVFGLGMWYLTRRAKQAEAVSEGYGEHNDHIVLHEEDSKLPSVFMSFLPMILVFILNYFFTWWFFQPNMIEYFTGQYPVDMDAALKVVNPIWPITASISISTILGLIVYKKYISNVNQTLTEGTVGSLLPIFNTGSENGYGGVIKLMPGFATLKTLLIGLPILPLAQMALATTCLAAVVGSSSAGTALALETFGDEFLTLMNTYGIPAEVVHRVVLLAAGCLDSLPHCGAVITLLTVTHLTHKESYKDIAFNTIVAPIISVVVVIAFYYVTGLY